MQKNKRILSSCFWCLLTPTSEYKSLDRIKWTIYTIYEPIGQIGLVKWAERLFRNTVWHFLSCIVLNRQTAFGNHTWWTFVKGSLRRLQSFFGIFFCSVLGHIQETHIFCMRQIIKKVLQAIYTRLFGSCFMNQAQQWISTSWTLLHLFDKRGLWVWEDVALVTPQRAARHEEVYPQIGVVSFHRHTYVLHTHEKLRWGQNTGQTQNNLLRNNAIFL